MNWFKGLNKVYKVIALFLLAFVVLIIAASISLAFESDEERAERDERIEQQEKEKKEADKAESKKEKEEKVKTKEKADKEVADKKKVKEKEVSKDDEKADDAWDDIKNKEKIIGKSDKGYKKITKSKPSKVRNDKTGKWRKSSFAENVDIEEYVLSYSDLYMKEDEIHFIINFNYGTTTLVSEMNGLLYVDINEYVDKEEHDASTLGSGMLLKSYVIYPDGDIQELEE